MDPDAVLANLRGCLDSRVEVRGPAERSLQEGEEREGFASCLTEVLRVGAREKEEEEAIAFLASVHLKNVVGRRWRRGGNLITEQEKTFLRNNLIHIVLSEGRDAVAMQVALSISKIARVDCPSLWPALVPRLTEVIRCTSGWTFSQQQQQQQVNGHLVEQQLASLRACQCLHYVLKELSSKRLPVDRKNFEAMSESIYPMIWQGLCEDTQAIVTSLRLSGEAQAALNVSMRRWTLLLKLVGRCLLYGTGQGDSRSLEEVEMVTKSVSVLVDALRAIMGLLEKYNSGFVGEWAKNSARRIVKALIAIQELHPWSFRSSLVPMIETTQAYVEGVSQITRDNRLLIQCVLFVHSVLRCSAYKTAVEMVSSESKGENIRHLQDTDRKKRKWSMGLEIMGLLQAATEASRLRNLTKSLLTKYIRLAAEELEEWAGDPENFHHEQEIENWQDCIRPCAESLLVLLVQEHADIVTPILLSEATEAEQEYKSDGPGWPLGEEVYRLEAAYAALCAAAYDLHPHVQFGSWLQTKLLPILRDTRACMSPLRRRVALLISKFVPCIPVETRPMTYEGLILLLREDEDICVRLAAGVALRSLVDDWNFEEDVFIPYIGPVFERLLALLSSVHMFETQAQIFSLLSLLIERLGERVAPFVGGLVSVLPGVWQEAEGESLVRIQVLLACQRLVVTMGDASPSLYPVILPMLTHAIDLNQPESLTLSEDGILLWQSLLRQSPSADPQLMHLVQAICIIIERGLEHLPELVRILQSYVLLFGRSFMCQYSGVVLDFLGKVLGNVKEKGLLITLPLIDMIVTIFPAEGPSLLQPALLHLLSDVLYNREGNLVRGFACSIIGRLLLHENSQNFTALFSAAVGNGLQCPSIQDGCSDPATNMLLAFLDRWIEVVDSIALYSRRKLVALSLCKFIALSIPSAVLVPRLTSIFAVITSVMHEIYEISDGDASSKLMNSDYFLAVCRSEYGGSAGEDDIGSEGNRRQAWFETDPVSKVDLGGMLNNCLAAATAGPSGAQLRAALSTIDSAVIRDLHKFLPHAVS